MQILRPRTRIDAVGVLASSLLPPGSEAHSGREGPAQSHLRGSGSSGGRGSGSRVFPISRTFS